MGNFTVRDDIESEYLKELKESMKDDGQWNPIIVRPSDGKYEVIAGHTRFQSAKELGWNDIDATVKDLSDEEADVLALKTNLMRKDMSEMEEGNVISRYIERYGLTHEQIANKLGKSRRWVSGRLSLVLHVSDYVKKLLEEGKLTAWQCALISSIENNNEQDEFAKYLVDNEIPSGRPTELALKRFKNKTIFTIGYEGKEIDDFVSILKENKIDTVIDIRASTESKHKPEFNGKVIERTLKDKGIRYEHYPELGIHYVVQEPYKKGYLKLECLKQWYNWNIETNVEFDKIVNHFKDSGKCVLLCMEKYATPLRNQEYHCHRHVLAEMIIKSKLFSERIDL